MRLALLLLVVVVATLHTSRFVESSANGVSTTEALHFDGATNEEGDESLRRAKALDEERALWSEAFAKLRKLYNSKFLTIKSRFKSWFSRTFRGAGKQARKSKARSRVPDWSDPSVKNANVRANQQGDGKKYEEHPLHRSNAKPQALTTSEFSPHVKNVDATPKTASEDTVKSSLHEANVGTAPQDVFKTSEGIAPRSSSVESPPQGHSIKTEKFDRAAEKDVPPGQSLTSGVTSAHDSTKKSLGSSLRPSSNTKSKSKATTSDSNKNLVLAIVPQRDWTPSTERDQRFELYASEFAANRKRKRQKEAFQSFMQILKLLLAESIPNWRFSFLNRFAKVKPTSLFTSQRVVAEHANHGPIETTLPSKRSGPTKTDNKVAQSYLQTLKAYLQSARGATLKRWNSSRDQLSKAESLSSSTPQHKAVDDHADHLHMETVSALERQKELKTSNEVPHANLPKDTAKL